MQTLIVDDDLVLADVLSFTLRRAGFDVIVAHDGQAALDRWQAETPDLIILDLNMPKMDGLSVCRRVRAEADTPIIILSVRGEENDIVRGLELGADDYIVKPFSPRQLVARAEALLRRAGVPSAPSDQVTVGDLSLDLSRHEVHCDGQTLAQNVTYLPFGPASGYDLGSGLTLNNTYDESYRLTDISAGSII